MAKSANLYVRIEPEIKEQADESAARTQAIIGDGVEKVKASLPLKSAL